MNNDILKCMEENYASFSKSHKRIADYIMANYEKVAYMTAAKLGEKVEVSESTVVRFATEIGFSGYPELLKTLKEVVPSKLTSIQRIEITSSNLSEQDILSAVINSDISKLKNTLQDIKREDFNNAVSSILSAKNIYIIGFRSSATLSGFLGFYFNLMFPNVKVINTNSASEVFEQFLNIKKEDVVIAISFPRYSKRAIQAVKYAKTCETKVIAITDSPSSPLNQYADYSLIASSDMVSFADSLVAPLSLINALIVAIAITKKEEVSQTFEKLEKIWTEYEVYDSPKREETNS